MVGCKRAPLCACVCGVGSSGSASHMRSVILGGGRATVRGGVDEGVGQGPWHEGGWYGWVGKRNWNILY